MLSIKIIIVALLLLIVISLAAGMFTLVNDGGDSNRTVKFLTFRIALSVFVPSVHRLFVLHGLDPAARYPPVPGRVQLIQA